MKFFSPNTSRAASRFARNMSERAQAQEKKELRQQTEEAAMEMMQYLSKLSDNEKMDRNVIGQLMQKFRGKYSDEVVRAAVQANMAYAQHLWKSKQAEKEEQYKNIAARLQAPGQASGPEAGQVKQSLLSKFTPEQRLRYEQDLNAQAAASRKNRLDIMSTLANIRNTRQKTLASEAEMNAPANLNAPGKALLDQARRGIVNNFGKFNRKSDNTKAQWYINQKMNTQTGTPSYQVWIPLGEEERKELYETAKKLDFNVISAVSKEKKGSFDGTWYAVVPDNSKIYNKALQLKNPGRRQQGTQQGGTQQVDTSIDPENENKLLGIGNKPPVEEQAGSSSFWSRRSTDKALENVRPFTDPTIPTPNKAKPVNPVPRANDQLKVIQPNAPVSAFTQTQIQQLIRGLAQVPNLRLQQTMQQLITRERQGRLTPQEQALKVAVKYVMKARQQQ